MKAKVQNKQLIVKNLANNVSEILIYGDIAETKFWGDEVTPNDVKEALDSIVSCSELYVRGNSYGGDTSAGHAIFSLVKAFKEKHNCQIVHDTDGISASSATIIAMAADKRRIAVGGIFMIHEPMIGFCGYRNFEELEKMKNILTVTKEAIVSVYSSTLGKDKDELNTLMKNETWMNAEKAIELGFVDEIIENSTVDVVMNSEKELIVNKVKIDCDRYVNKPTQLFNMAKIQKPENKISLKKEEEDIELKNAAELKENYPELFEEVKNLGIEEGQTTERNRIKNIVDIAKPGMDDLLNQAKFDKAITPGDFAIAQAKAEKEKTNSRIKNRAEDAEPINKLEIGASNDGTKDGPNDKCDDELKNFKEKGTIKNLWKK